MTSIVDIAVPLSEHESAAASRLVDCEICFEAVPDADCLAIAGCGHKFCTLCVKVCDMALVVACSELIPPRCLVWSCLGWQEHVVSCMGEGCVEIQCPADSCHKKLGASTLLSAVGSTVYAKLVELSLSRAVDTHPNFHRCQTPECR